MATIARALLAIVFLLNQVIPGNFIPKAHNQSQPLQTTQEVTPTDSGYPPPVEETATPALEPSPTVTMTVTPEPDSSPTPTQETPTAIPTFTETPLPSASPTPQATEEDSAETGESGEVLELTTSEEFYVPGETITLAWRLRLPDTLSAPVLKIFYSQDTTLQDEQSESVVDKTQEAGPDGQRSYMVDIANGGGNLDFQTNADSKQSLHFRAVLYDGDVTEYSTEIKLKAAQVFHTNKEKKSSTENEGSVRLEIPEGALASDATFYAYSSDLEDLPNSLSGSPITIVARQDDTQASIEHFDKPIAIEYQYNDLFVSPSDEENLALFYFSEAENTWIPLPSMVDTENNLVIGYSDHLSFFDFDVNKWEAARLPTMEGFQTSLFTGAATYSYAFEVPTGPGNLQPELTLSYNSQAIDRALSRTQASWVGMGWSLDTGYIERNIHDTQNRSKSEGHLSDYDPSADDTFSIVVNGVSDVLLPIPESEGDGDPATVDYRTASDSFWRIRRYNLTPGTGISNDNTNISVKKDVSYWIACDKSGNQYRFGTNAAGDGGTSYYMEWYKGWEGGVYSSDSGWGTLRPWRWSLTVVTNTSNKSITYTYENTPKTVDYSSRSPSYEVNTAVYPKEILYPHGNYRVRFELSERSDYDTAWEDVYANIRYQKEKLSAVVVEQYNGSAWALMRKYRLEYYANAESPIFPGFTWWPLGGKTLTLKSITEVGSDNTSALPAITFTYDSMHLTEARNGYGGKVVYEYEATPWHSADAPEDWKVEGRFDDDVVNNIDGVCGNNIPEKISGNDLGWEPVNPSNTNDDFTSCITSDYGYVTLRGHTYNASIAENFQPGGWYRFSLYVAGAGNNFTLWINNGIPQGTTIALPSGWNTYSYEGYLPGNIGNVRLIANCLTANGNQGNCGIKRHSFTLLPTRYRVTSKLLFASSTDTEPTQMVSYEYYGAAMNDASNSAAASQPKETRYNDLYTEFRGHDHVIATYSNGQVVTTYFHQDDIYKGQIGRVTIANADGNIFSENIYEYTSENYSLDTAGSYFPKNASGAAYTDLLGYRVHTEWETSKNYNGDVAVPADTSDNPALMWSGERTEYHYQTAQQGGRQYGNMTQTVQSYWSGSSWQDYRLTWSEYYPRNEQTATGKYIVGLPGYTNVYTCPSDSQGGSCYHTNDSVPTIDRLLSSTIFIYDSETPITGRSNQPTKGLLTQVRKLIDLNPNDNTQRKYQDTFTVYNEWAMPTSLTTYTGYGTATAVASTGPQVTTTVYDSAYHTYPTSITQNTPGSSPLNRTTTIGYHPVLGLPASETDPNGAVTSAVYDVFGRMAKLIRPGDTDSSPTLAFSYHAEAVPFWTELRQKIDGTNSQTTRKFYDGLGNLIQEQTVNAEVPDNRCSSDSNSDPDICNVVVNHQYLETGAGTLTRVSDPSAVTPAAGYNTTALANAVWSTVQTDILGRTIQTTQFDGTFSQNAYTIQDFSLLGSPTRGLDVAATDALGQTTHSYSDGHGRAVQVIAPLGPYLVYGYDELDRLTRVDQVNRDSNAIFATTTLTLDIAGRKTAMTDPDMGYWSYAYDALGNLLTQTDAKAQTIWMKYDALNRLLEKRDGSSTGTLLASYSYDLSSSTNKGIGRRTGMSDASGSTAWEFDLRGRTIHERRHVLDGVNDLGTYNTYWTYYTNDSVRQMVYPNHETINYGYNQSGALEQVYSIQDETYAYHYYVSASGYDESGRILNRSLGNGVRQNYTYYPWTQSGGRLSNLTTNGAQTYQNLTYTYDANGNIGSITDAVANETLNFTYDDINRLDTASGAYSEDPVYETGTGNIQSRNGISYTYDPAHVHAVASTSFFNTYSYDANGNMKSRSVSGKSYTLAYDKENRLTAISGSASARYVYDGDGKRVLAVENGVRTLYIGDYFEAELGSATVFPVFVPDLDNTGLPNKFYLPIIKNGAGAGTPPPANPGNGFYFTHPIHPNQSAITWRMYYTAGQRVAMRVSHGPTASPYPAPGATQDEVYYMLGDHLGSTTVTLNLDGTVKSRVRYDAWGKTRYTSGTTPTDRKYTGQIEEATIGLYFYNARWYDPSLGRFIQADNIVPEAIQGTQAWDRYAYSDNNPIRFIDPSGHWITSALGGLLGGALGLATYAILARNNFDIGEAIVSTGTFALAGVLIGTGIGAAAGIQMAANSALAVAASSVGSGVAGGAYGYSVQLALHGGDFDASSFALAGIGGAIDSGINLVLPTPIGRMAASGVLSVAQSSTNAMLHEEEYNRDDLLGDFSGGVLSSYLIESTTLGPRALTRWDKLIPGNPIFANQVAKQELFLAGYETLRSGLISSDQMKKPWQLFTKAVVWAGDKLTGK